MPALRIVTACLLTVWLFGCNIDNDKRVSLDDMRFETEDHTRIFFRNVRRSFYDVQPMEAAQQELYRLSDRLQGEGKPRLGLVIVNKLALQKAFVMLEPNAPLAAEETLTVHWRSADGADSGSESMEKLAPITEHFRLATALYSALQDGCEVEIEVGGQRVSILTEEEERKNFRTVMVDYYRLVNILK